MNSHPYIRAYMAGVVAPTLFLIVVVSAFVVVRLVLQFPVPIERIIVFPMAAVPNIWGLWNMLYVRLRARRNISIGLHGALLPLLMGPTGGLLACTQGFLNRAGGGLVYFNEVHISYGFIACALCIGMAIYYLAWKYLVNFFNGLVGIA
jgi:hypothetical protein